MPVSMHDGFICGALYDAWSLEFNVNASTRPRSFIDINNIHIHDILERINLNQDNQRRHVINHLIVSWC